MKKISLLALLAISCNSFAGGDAVYHLASQENLKRNMLAIGANKFDMETGLAAGLQKAIIMYEDLEISLSLAQELYPEALRKTGLNEQEIQERVEWVSNNQKAILAALLKDATVNNS